MTPAELTVAVIQAAALLCEHVGQAKVAARVQSAVERVVLRGDARTPDLGGDATTAEFTDAVIDEVTSGVGAS